MASHTPMALRPAASCAPRRLRAVVLFRVFPLCLLCLLCLLWIPVVAAEQRPSASGSCSRKTRGRRPMPNSTSLRSGLTNTDPQGAAAVGARDRQARTRGSHSGVDAPPRGQRRRRPHRSGQRGRATRARAEGRHRCEDAAPGRARRRARAERLGSGGGEPWPARLYLGRRIRRSGGRLARRCRPRRRPAVRIDEVLGAVEGLESLSRLAKISKLKDATIRGLRAASGLEGRKEDAEKLARSGGWPRRHSPRRGAATGRRSTPGLPIGMTKSAV